MTRAKLFFVFWLGLLVGVIWGLSDTPHRHSASASGQSGFELSPQAPSYPIR